MFFFKSILVEYHLSRLQDLLTDVEKVLYVDTDAVFLRPVEDIWNLFGEFNSTQMAGLAQENEKLSGSSYIAAKHPYYKPAG